MCKVLIPLDIDLDLFEPTCTGCVNHCPLAYYDTEDGYGCSHVKYNYKDDDFWCPVKEAIINE